VITPDLLTLEMLADVCALVEQHLPAEYRSKSFQLAPPLLKRAAEGQQDVAEVSAHALDRAAAGGHPHGKIRAGPAAITRPAPLTLVASTTD
jgi:hypothetical protein